MKLIESSKIIIILGIAVLQTSLTSASDIETTIGSITYGINIEDSSASVTRCDRDVEEVNLPSSITYEGREYLVTNIYGGAFKYCSQLKRIYLPNTISFIGEEAFNDCGSLKEIKLPESIKSIGKGAFNACGSLESISVPNGVSSIEDFTFSYCHNLSTINLGDNISSIGQYAFYYCTSLDTIEIPNSVIVINPNSFKGCTSLKSAIIGSSVTSIGDFAFENCSDLCSLKIGDSVVSIGQSCFRNCTALETVELPNTLKNISENAFYDCHNIEWLKLGNSIQTINMSAFYGCSGMKSVEISDLEAWCNISFLLNSASSPLWNGKTDLYFNGEKVSDLVIPASIKLKFASFMGCNSIESVKLCEGISSIGGEGREFQDCKNLKSIYLPSSLRIISGFSFSSCIGLENIYSYSTTPPFLDSYYDYSYIDSYPFANCDTGRICLHIPKGTKDKYQSVDGWRNFQIIIDDLDPNGLESDDVEEIINNSEAESNYLFNLQGIRLRLISSKADFDNLQSGIYIWDGKKIYIR